MSDNTPVSPCGISCPKGCREFGRFLLKARKEYGRKGWGFWLKKNLGMTRLEAFQFIREAKESGCLNNVRSVQNKLGVPNSSKTKVRWKNEKALEIEVARSLGKEERVSRQVICSAGRADLVTPTRVIEVELRLDRSKLFEAVGQVLMYRQSINPTARAEVIVGVYEGDPPLPIEIAEKLGVRVFEWEYSRRLGECRRGIEKAMGSGGDWDEETMWQWSDEMKRIYNRQCEYRGDKDRI